MRFLVFLILAGTLSGSPLARAADAPAIAATSAELSQNAVPAAGTRDVVLTVTQFGRYAIIISSAQGVALQLVDRMAGPGGIDGVPGQTDGRLDLFLDRGTYKIHVIADARGSGAAKLRVLSFQELQKSPVQLVENNPVLAELGDGQQISWWLNVPEQGTYDFEAGGRYLNELRLWKDGGWITGDMPLIAESDADPEQPLALRQLSAQLEPGLYRLTAYGGPSMHWSSGSKDAPFMLRWGVPQLADSGRTVHTASILGIDRYLIPGTAADIRLVLDKSVAASIFAQPGATMFQPWIPQEADISKTSRDPVADLSLTGGGTTPWLVTVSMKPGEKYRLEVTNEQGNTGPVNAGSGDALIATTLQGDPDDELDPGFILVNAAQAVVQSSVINLDTALPWRRRFNLLGEDQTFLYAGQNINLKVDGNAQFIVDRFLVNPPWNHVVPTPKASGGVWTLTPGYYVLDVLPVANGRGILTMSMVADGTKPPAHDSPRLPAALFPDVSLDPTNNMALFSSFANFETNVEWGLRQEALPAALARPLSFELAPGRKVNFPIELAENARLTVTAENGSALSFSLDGQKSNGSAEVDTNKHDLALSWPGPQDMFVTVAQTPMRLLDPTLPPLPADQMTLPKFPVIQPGQPYYVDLDRQQTDIFGLKVDQPALYRFETTGLIETGGTIRTRIVTSLGSVEGNGIGRNFMLQQYLDQGDYQLTVQAQGQTTGHAGVAVTATPVVDGGVLALDLPSRITLQPGQAALYRFHIARDATYHLFTLGLGHQFAMRLEDADGWPLVAPGGTADTTMDFAPGDYRMVLLPGTVENRAVTMLQDFPPPVTYSGHGPFAVVLGQDLQNRWMEPLPGKPRLPDVWTLSLPAAATLTFSLDSGMQARVFADGATPPQVVFGSGWSGSLGPGDYHIDVVRAVPDNRVDYTLHLDAKELLPGQSDDVQAPETIRVSLGREQVEISSFGAQDVRAVLYDAQGRIMAANDDRDNDWNFLIAGAFPAGKYQLEIDPVGADNAETTVSIAAPMLVQDAPLAFGRGRNIVDGLVHVMPVPPVPAGRLLLAGAASAAPVGLAVECAGSGGWRTLASTTGINPYLAIPSGGHGYRLRVWAEDHGQSPITVTVLGLAQQATSGAALAAGMALAPVTLGPVTLGVGHVRMASPAILVPYNPPTSLQWSSAADIAAARDEAGTLTAAGADLWLVDASPHVQAAPPADLGRGSTRLTVLAGQRIELQVPQPYAGAVLWQAQAQGGQPGIALGASGVMAAGNVTGLLATTLAVQLPGGGGALGLWQAGPAQDAALFTLRRYAFVALRRAWFSVGGQNGILASVSGLCAMLPPGFKRVSLTLPAGTAAALVKGGRVLALVAANGTVPDVLDSDASQLLLLNPGGADLPYNVQVETLAAPGLALGPGGWLTQYSPMPAVLHIALPPGQTSRLHMGGSVESLIAIGDDGKVSSGDGALAFGGAAIIATGPGLAVLSADSPAGSGAGQLVAVPGNVPLRGGAELLSVPPGAARLVTLQTDVPVVLRDRVTGIPTIYPSGAAASLFQPKGQRLDLDLLAAGAGLLGGDAHLATIPALPITDGLGPDFAVGPGQSRLFTFSLTSPRRIGVGVRGNVDDAICRLLASDGTELGSGVVQMHDLAPGTYYLAVDVPADGVTTNLQPSLVGLTPPDDGPPPDVIDSYRDLARAAVAGEPAQ